MSWMIERKHKWRAAILILMVLALLGPWGFDRISVPAKYPCDPPNIRLEGDFCGLPISGIRNLGWMISGLFMVFVTLISGEINLYQAGLTFGSGLIVILLLLPIFNILFILKRGNRPRFQKFHLMICALDFGLLLVLGFANHPRFFYALWGLWLYIGLLLSTLILEWFWRKENAPRLE